MKLLWTVLLLALLPLTMAPRTATEPAPEDGLKVVLSRPAGGVAPGAAVPLHITLTNVEASRRGGLAISATMTDARVRVVSTSSQCRISGSGMRCPFDLDKNESVRFKLTVRPMSAGELIVEVNTAEGLRLAADSIRVARDRG